VPLSCVSLSENGLSHRLSTCGTIAPRLEKEVAEEKEEKRPNIQIVTMKMKVTVTRAIE